MSKKLKKPTKKPFNEKRISKPSLRIKLLLLSAKLKIWRSNLSKQRPSCATLRARFKA